MAGNEKIRITNIYIPPIRNTAGERARGRGTHFGTDRWPSLQNDIIMGDIDAHSALWDDAVKSSNTSYTGDKRGEIVEEWLMENDMLALNDGRPTHINRSTGTKSTRDSRNSQHERATGR